MGGTSGASGMRGMSREFRGCCGSRIDGFRAERVLTISWTGKRDFVFPGRLCPSLTDGLSPSMPTLRSMIRSVMIPRNTCGMCCFRAVLFFFLCLGFFVVVVDVSHGCVLASEKTSCGPVPAHSLVISLVEAVDREYDGPNTPEGEREKGRGGWDALGTGACNSIPDTLPWRSSYDHSLLRSVPLESPIRGLFCRRRDYCFAAANRDRREGYRHVHPCLFGPCTS